MLLPPADPAGDGGDDGMSLVARDRCRACRKPLRDPISRHRVIGPDCWKRMSAEEQAEALALAEAERQPGYVPPMRPPSWIARLNAEVVGQVVLEATEPDEKRCSHGFLARTCPECQREADARYALRVKTTADRILELVRAQPREQRTAERIRHVTARIAKGFPDRPARRPAPEPEPAAPPPTEQLELL